MRLVAKVPPFDIDARTAKDPHTTSEVVKAFTSLQQLLIQLNFTDNFKGFLWEGTIDPSAEKKIQHRLGVVPSGYIVTFCQGGTVQAGPTLWTKTHVYLTNISGADAAIAKVFFFV